MATFLLETCPHSKDYWSSKALYFQYESFTQSYVQLLTCFSLFCCDALNLCRPPRCSSGCSAGAWSISWNCSHQLATSHYRCCRDLQRSPCNRIHYICWQKEGKNFMSVLNLNCNLDFKPVFRYLTKVWLSFFYPRCLRCLPQQLVVSSWVPLRSTPCWQLTSSPSEPHPPMGSPVTLCQLMCPQSWLPSWQARLSLPQLCHLCPVLH